MRKLMAAGAVLLGMSTGVFAAGDVEQAINASLKNVNARLTATSIQEAPVAGLYEVELNNGDVVYATASGEYFFTGPLLRYQDDKGLVNVTEQKFNENRKVKMSQLKQEDLVSYPPKGEVKAVVNVFTDVDCPYCRKLHDEVPKLNEMGIQVNYLAFPRQGYGSKAYHKMNAIWCGKPGERVALMDKVKDGKDIDNASCDSPVMAQYALGQQVGVTGTPAMVLEDGSLVPGYMPAERLVKMLDIN
ncbi:thioredoxin fold domain-containing protein [Marinobacterium jannaschii]|uniref:thioredoxin fold domain-containing protein n=1 Tax=Marinobacterium jannaschii TaxID=64970 RepID=UPI00047FDD67|nr:thioredoxin fold domain-containing protein [Marinobacterium jannaschii]